MIGVFDYIGYYCYLGDDGVVGCDEWIDLFQVQGIYNYFFVMYKNCVCWWGDYVIIGYGLFFLLLVEVS